MGLTEQLEKAERLAAVTQKIGFTIWQLQELEWTLANYLVVKLHAKRGIGEEAGHVLLENAGKKTFGSLLKELVKSGAIASDLAEELDDVLAERNWIVHRSRRESRGVLNSAAECVVLTSRLEKTSVRAGALLKRIAQLMEQHVINFGVSAEAIELESNKFLEKWGLLGMALTFHITH